MKNEFQCLKGKKVIIYGTGRIAERLIQAQKNLEVIGIVDKVKLYGERYGCPILMWDDLCPSDAEAIIIAAPQKYYLEIYLRIIDKCISFRWLIIGANGEDLRRYFGTGMNPYQDFGYYERNAMELQEKLRGYDVISFDIYDTLVMRRTLEPMDIFDIVQARLKEQGLPFEGFKALRREAELLSEGKNIYVIYEWLQELTGINDTWKKRILEQELECEREFTVPRKSMVEIFNSALDAGKRVYLVSDMYLTTDILTLILQDCGIKGYKKLFLSCEYGISKEGGLFQRLREEIGDCSCIHIGDNMEADERPARSLGMDTYGVRSAYDMLRNSNLRYISGFLNSMNDKNLTGLIISHIFNDPFALYHTSGILELSSLAQVGMVLLAPVAVLYMVLLADKLRRETYDGVLFVARDQYFFARLYDRLFKPIFCQVPFYYICSSRKLSLRSGSSQVTRDNYKEYLTHLGIDLNKKYLLCELDGKGTSHFYLNRLFGQELDSFYLVRQHYKDNEYQVRSEAVYDTWRADLEYNSMNRNTVLLESIFSSPCPSVEDMSEGGKPLFGIEVRTQEQIQVMLKMQEAMEYLCLEYFQAMYTEHQPINRELPIHFLELFPYIHYTGECEALYRMTLYDELNNSFIDLNNCGFLMKDPKEERT